MGEAPNPYAPPAQLIDQPADPLLIGPYLSVAATLSTALAVYMANLPTLAGIVPHHHDPSRSSEVRTERPDGHLPCYRTAVDLPAPLVLR